MDLHGHENSRRIRHRSGVQSDVRNLPRIRHCLMLLLHCLLVAAIAGCTTRNDRSTRPGDLTPGDVVDSALSALAIDEKMFESFSVKAIRMDSGWLVLCDATEGTGTMSSFSALVGPDGVVSNLESHVTEPN